MDKELIVSSSPHIRHEDGTKSIMLDVVIALAFPLGIAVFQFGWRAAVLAAVSVASCVIFEYLYRKLMRKSNTVGDLSAVVTGLLLAFCLPAGAPYWIAIIGAFFAIVIVKQLFGGLGKNFMNPALAARAFLFSWPVIMTTWTTAGNALPVWGDIPDAVTGATPMAALKNGALPSVSIQDLFLGQVGGSMGEISAIVLLLGGIYLWVRGVITPRIPLSFMGTVAVITYFFPPEGVNALEFMLAHLLSGGLVLGAVFMATDYATSPVTKNGQILFGVGCGLLTVFIRYFGALPEGVCYAILIMNSCVWLLDKAGGPRRFGTSVFSRKGGGK